MDFTGFGCYITPGMVVNCWKGVPTPTVVSTRKGKVNAPLFLAVIAKAQTFRFLQQKHFLRREVPSQLSLWVYYCT
jgi:hypothetical protein